MTRMLCSMLAFLMIVSVFSGCSSTDSDDGSTVSDIDKESTAAVEGVGEDNILDAEDEMLAESSDLAEASSQQIMWLKVGGSVTEPDIKQELLPGLNESLRQLFAGPETNEESPRQSADPFSTPPVNR